MEQQKAIDPAVSFAVDLEAEEYVSFNKTMYGFAGGKKLVRTSVLFGVVMLVLLIAEVIAAKDWQLLLEPDILLMMGMAVVLCFFLWVVEPLKEKRKAQKTYDLSLAAGQVYAGMVSVHCDHITKATQSGTLTLSFAQRILFIEKEDMMIFVNTQGQGIVLPARCMTSEQAAAVRQFAQGALPPSLVLIRKPCNAVRTTPYELPQVEVAPPLFTCTVRYTDEENKYLIGEIIKRDMVEAVPFSTVAAFTLSLLFGLNNGFVSAAIGFWIVIALYMGLRWLFWMPRRKQFLKQDAQTLTVLLTDGAVVTEKQLPAGKMRVAMGWKDIRHALESEDAIEFVGKKQYFYIPKRTIGDMELFKRIVDEHMHPAAERNG